MSERARAGGGGAGAPFYAPRRKTSAEIISEARAALYGEPSASSSSGGGGGSLRPLRTRRPFTPRDPQRTLFSDPQRRTDPRPPSAFNLKYLSVAESAEEAVHLATGTRVASLDEGNIKGILLTEPQTSHAKKKSMLRTQSRSLQERQDSWAGYTKLPHLSGRSKPLHRRNHSGASAGDESKSETDLAHAISVTKPFGAPGVEDTYMSGEGSELSSKSLGPNSRSKRKPCGVPKSQSCDVDGSTMTYQDDGALGDIAVRHLDVQLPNTSNGVRHNESLSVLELAEALCHKSRDVDRTVMLMDALQHALQATPPAHSLRDLTLRSLYTYIDSDDVRVLVGIARAMLTLKVTGAHLAAACKLVFKVAKNDKNDHFFRTTNLLELLVEGCARAEPVSEGECCVYGAGALRFLALEPRLRAAAHRAGALHLAALHLKILNTAKAENPRGISEQSTHALYQLTGALRNLAGGAQEPCAFIASGALAELLCALQLHHTDRDVLTNVVRCLSVLSSDDSCCEWLCACASSAPALLTALAACASRAPLAVRLAYTLGNMAAADDHARINIYSQEGGIDVLLTILESYTKRNDRDTRDPVADPDLHLIGSDLGGSDGSNEDVLIKTVRVVANLCLAESVGRALAETHAERIVRALLRCLEMAEKAAGDTNAITDLEEEGDGSGEERRQELATASLATLNNVTFYSEPPAPPDPLATLLEKLCTVTCRWVSGAGAAASEAVRALGNLTRCPRMCRLIVIEGALETLAPYLQHEEASTRCAAAGVLVNVCGAGCAGAAAVAARSLTLAARSRDAPAAALLTRALWNAHAHAPLAAHDARRAAAALDLFIDDESVFVTCEALRSSDRRASDPELSKQHVKFDLNENRRTKPFFKSCSVDQELYLDSAEDPDGTGCSGEDLGFEEGDLGDCGCECFPCRRLAEWEELVGVAIPLLDKLRPMRANASVGTD